MLRLVNPVAFNVVLVLGDETVAQGLTELFTAYALPVVRVASLEFLAENMSADMPTVCIMDQWVWSRSLISLFAELRVRSLVGVFVMSRDHGLADVLIALESGADGHWGADMEPREILARVSAVVRRAPFRKTFGAVASKAGPAIWRIDTFTKKCFAPSGALVTLSPSEVNILYVLLKNFGMMIERSQLGESIIARGTASGFKRIDVLISHIRTHLRPHLGDCEIIRSYRKRGYALVAAEMADWVLVSNAGDVLSTREMSLVGRYLD
jgi:DNA-binding response OmpR family regulator